MKLTNRISESKRRIASLNRSDESNQRIEPQNGSKTTPKRSKTSPKTAQIGPKSPQERPKTPQDGPKTAQGALLRRSWSHLGTIRSQDRKPDRSKSMVGRVWGRCWLPKWIPKRDRNFRAKKLRLGSDLGRSWVVGHFLLIFYWLLFFISWTSTFSMLIAVQERSWTQKRRKMDPS